jgi:hypothetical protein
MTASGFPSTLPLLPKIQKIIFKIQCVIKVFFFRLECLPFRETCMPRAQTMVEEEKNRFRLGLGSNKTRNSLPHIIQISNLALFCVVVGRSHVDAIIYVTQFYLYSFDYFRAAFRHRRRSPWTSKV